MFRCADLIRACTNTTIDGVTIPSPESAVRQVNLATIPADMVQSIELNKTLSANQDADGIGGSVNMVTKMAGEGSDLQRRRHAGLYADRKHPLYGLDRLYAGQALRRQQALGPDHGRELRLQRTRINDIEPAPDLNPRRQQRLPITTASRCASIAIHACAGAEPWARITKLNDHSTLAAHFCFRISRTGATSGTTASRPTTSPSSMSRSGKPDFAIGSLSVGGNHIFDKFWVHLGFGCLALART